MTRIVICNVYPDDNRGSAALTSAAITLVQSAFPEADITLLALSTGIEQLEHGFRHTRASFPDVTIVPTPLPIPEGRLGGLRSVLGSIGSLAFGRSNLQPGLEVVRRSDVVVSRGGVIFRPRSNRGLAGLWRTAYPLVFASRSNVPSITMPTHIGPFETYASRQLNGFILRRIDQVVAREAESASWARRVGVAESRVKLLPDSVFALASPSPTDTVEMARRFDLTVGGFGCATISADVLRMPDRDRFIHEFGSALSDTLNRGLVDSIAIVVQVDGRLESDLDASRLLMASVNDSRFRLIAADLSVEKLAALYGAAAFTVGCRLHAAILSLIAGTPAFPVDLGSALGVPKAFPVFSSLGLSDWVLGYHNLSNASERIARESTSEQVTQRLSSTVQAERDLVTAGYSTLLKTAASRLALPRGLR